ncbi:helix-turn-helix domain-containing protein (plasmid) [Paraburkholderia sprentiae WSM5005]|uniref:Helix-turn-helix domain-containing protein n=1 Tax=Paraburkholderia sprentiae WSM5005 TaxID=754502 RepID=A0A1I9YUC1_9BURK|nr:helix-turn-helix domain-containing protein [Paraburkholderia sprentiae]APA89790.1 helix-turn-helix domain-containing protein [Paraburkholderia sprentiae WSM5005]
MQIETPGASEANPPQLDDTKAQRGISALDNTGELLLALVAAGRPLSLRDLAAAADMPAAKAFPHLVSLLKVGLLSRDDAGLFGAGPLGMELGLIALQRLSPIRDAEPEIVALAAQSGMSVAVAILGPLGPTVIRFEESARPQHVSLRVGTVVSLVNTAIGRVFAAHLADDVLVGLLSQESIRLAGAPVGEVLVSPKKGVTSLAPAYLARRAKVVKEGIDDALDAPVPGIGTLAAPVFDHTGSVTLVVAVIGTSSSFDYSLQGTTAQRLLATTRRLSWRFGWIGR